MISRRPPMKTTRSLEATRRRNVLLPLAIVACFSCGRGRSTPAADARVDTDAAPVDAALVVARDAAPADHDAASPPRPATRPHLAFSAHREGGVDVVREGIPAVAEDGSLAVVRFETDGTVCGLPQIVVFDVVRDKARRAFEEPQSRCDHDKGLPGPTGQPNPIWKEWESSFRTVVGERSWVALTPSPEAHDDVLTNRVVLDGLVVRLANGPAAKAGAVDLLIEEASSGSRLASIDLVAAHASSRINELGKRRPWRGTEPAMLLEVYASRERRVVVARAILSLGDNASFPAMDHVVRW